MGLLRRYKEFRQNRKARRIVGDILARPYPTPSEISESVASLPRSVKRAHKLSVRRQYRSPAFKGIASSLTRQDLIENFAVPAFNQAQAELQRQREEDEKYGSVAAFD